jgi:hypothetical protein
MFIHSITHHHHPFSSCSPSKHYNFFLLSTKTPSTTLRIGNQNGMILTSCLSTNTNGNTSNNNNNGVLPDAVSAYHVNINKVPRLPLPEVKQTITRYIETLEPLLSQPDLERNKKLAKEFSESKTAADLQALLVKQSKKDGYPYHYFEDAWDDMYYGGRW